MGRYPKYFVLIVATLLFTLTAPLLPIPSHYSPVVVQAQMTQDKVAEVVQLNQEGLQQYRQGQYVEALETFQQILALAREFEDKIWERSTLHNLTTVYSIQGQYNEALEYYQQLLAVVRELEDKEGEGTTLNNMGRVYGAQGQYPQAIDFYQQALTIARELNNTLEERTILYNIAVAYNNQGQYATALEYYQQLLAVVREVGDKVGEFTILNNIAVTYSKLGQYTEALVVYEREALAVVRELNDQLLEGELISNIATIYYTHGQYAQALELNEQALGIYQQVGETGAEVTTLSNIAVIYNILGQHDQALEIYQQALDIVRDIDRHQELSQRAEVAKILNQIGEVYQSQGDDDRALELYEQALRIAREIGNKTTEKRVLNNLAIVYTHQEQYTQALELYQQALRIVRAIGDKAGERTILSNMAVVYRDWSQDATALELYQQALAIQREIGDLVGEGTTLTNIGKVYFNLSDNTKALEFYLRALAIQREIGDQVSESTTLSNLGVVLAQQQQPELAIVFYKQSVNLREKVRQEIKVLPTELQQSYTETVAGTYRRLADLLLQQDRVLEAQQVLDLLKVQELEDYLRNVRGNKQTPPGVDYLLKEQEVVVECDAKLTQIVQLGRELNQLQAIAPTERTPEQEQQRRTLETAQQELSRNYLDFIRTPEIVALVQQLNRTTGGENLNPRILIRLQDDLKQLAQDAVLLYPLILKDRLELVLVTPYTPPIRRSIPVNRKELNRAIVNFRSALTNPTSNAIEPAQQLYNWLIQPIEAALTEANAKTIIYAPDGQLRYIPLAALHDGNQWLVEKYRINHITALSLTDLDTKPQVLNVLAGAFTQGNYNIQVGDRTFNLVGLPFAGQEVEILAETLPNTTKLLDSDFSEEETLARMSDYSILHLATHATFVTGLPEESFILFGNGDRATFRDVELWPLTNTDLVVLSACETGLGGQFGNGEEILGFGYLMETAGARAAIASLWSVDDGGTQVLMNAFYGALQGNKTKAEALRLAQVALITGDYTALGEQRGSIVALRVRDEIQPEVANRLNHPYYWAPFILIGNGL